MAGQLQTVKKFLVAANLDPTALAGGTPQAALDLMAREERDAAMQALSHPSADHDPTSWFSRFNPDTAVLASQEVKVQGRVTFEGDGDNGLLVHTDYTFVYALVPGPHVYRPAAQPSPQGGGGATSAPTDGGAQSAAWLQLSGSTPVTREIVRRQQDFRFFDHTRYSNDPTKITFGKGQSDTANNYCVAGDGWLEPEFPQTVVGNDDPGPSSGPTSDPYDRSKPLPDDGKCGTASRT
ncbi:hypothetical protein P3T36_003204 [Kitasatospora sp. MAP12-15]|uniref:hypothetical protein n=1 Tax=unclassified Kitasatospora TaxID=2633591 RepID=UPI002474BBC9|nr:hypothetical protein [Kitasatospora sp. MAP12-44]MDH6111180.1 hypothetical protein [Kitasatospora sp. MAP12-44]